MSNFKVTMSRDGTRDFNDYENGQNRRGGGGPKWRSRGRRNNNYRGGRGGGKGPYNGPNPRSRLEDDDIDMDGAGGGQSSQSNRRFTPYGGGGRDRRGGGKFRRDNKGAYQRLGLPVSGGSNPRRDGGSNWCKVTIIHGNKYSKDLIISSLTDYTKLAVIPKCFQFEGTVAIFYVDDKEVGNAIRNASRKIEMPNGFKMICNVYFNCQPPNTLAIDDETEEKLKVFMSSKYDPATKALDLTNLYGSKALNDEGIFLQASKSNVANCVVKIIEENIPQLEALNLSRNRLFTCEHYSKLPSIAKSLKKLDMTGNQIKNEMNLEKLKGLPLVELILDKNPICDYYKDETKYVSAIRKRFPEILKLDGHDLPPPIKFDLSADVELPATQGSYFPDEASQVIAIQFLEQYYAMYDSSDRQGLLNAYHDKAYFSLSVSFNSLIPSKQPSLQAYTDDSHNLIRVKESYRRQKLIKSGRLNVVALLSTLPDTQHDPSSLKVDIPLCTPGMMVIVVHGLYKEVKSKSTTEPIRWFSRTFITVPQGSGIVISNEELTITNADPKAAEKFKTKMTPPTPSTSTASSPVSSPPGGATVPTAEIKEAMVKQFSEQSKMNLEYTVKCLESNNWDYELSAKKFLELQASGAIPPEAFAK